MTRWLISCPTAVVQCTRDDDGKREAQHYAIAERTLHVRQNSDKVRTYHGELIVIPDDSVK
jgi:hypothetical protein